MRVILEIRAGEGGEDARLLVRDHAKIYRKWALNNDCLYEELDSSASWLTILVDGNSANALFSEAGGHRYQRVSPTERRGRIHTSTVTVAVLEINSQSFSLNDGDVLIRTTKDSGPGGQHRNKTESCVVMKHIPTGIEAKSALKHQHQNREIARVLLENRVKEYYETQKNNIQNINRRNQIGSGMRGDKIKTYRFRDNVVLDHRNGNKIRLNDVLAGKL